VEVFHRFYFIAIENAGMFECFRAKTLENGVDQFPPQFSETIGTTLRAGRAKKRPEIVPGFNVAK